MKLYAISGLGADKRVFQYLKVEYEIIPLDWIKPNENESIEDYADRFSQNVNTKDKFGILGVSFGGLIAVELSKILKPELTILISTIKTRDELRSIYRIVGKSKFLKVIPKKVFNPPRIIGNWIFGAENKTLLNQILNDTDLGFAKWAVNELLDWKNKEVLTNKTIVISGSDDKLLPPAKRDDIMLIPNGEHFMIVDRADEVSRIINEEMRKWLMNSTMKTR